MKKDKLGFSIVTGMGLALISTLSAYVILSYIIPFSRGVKGIENMANAYYVSYSGIEEALYHIKTRERLNVEAYLAMPASPVGYSYSTFSSGSSVPLAGSGNSEFDKNYNIISPTEPLQLEVGNGYQTNPWNQVNFYFRAPDLNGNGRDDETLSGGTSPIISWMLVSENDALIASGSYISANDVKGVNCSGYCNWKIDGKLGVTLSGITQDFQTYYDSNCPSNSKCTLKFSIINPLIGGNNTKIPYLEYRITGLSRNFPSRYTIIKSSGKSYGYQKDLEVRIPQQTVSQAFDFTVFQ